MTKHSCRRTGGPGRVNGMVKKSKGYFVIARKYI